MNRPIFVAALLQIFAAVSFVCGAESKLISADANGVMLAFVTG